MENLRRQYEVNATGIIHVPQAFLCLFLRRALRGRVVNMGSLTARVSLPFADDSYSSSKSALTAMTHEMRRELGPWACASLSSSRKRQDRHLGQTSRERGDAARKVAPRCVAALRKSYAGRSRDGSRAANRRHRSWGVARAVLHAFVSEKSGPLHICPEDKLCVHVKVCYAFLRGLRDNGGCPVTTKRRDRQNVTLSLPREVVQEVKVIAARRDTSISALMAEVLGGIVDEERGYRAARERSLRRLSRGLDLGTGGGRTWTRDELHER